MVGLEDLIGAIISHVGRGRSQADVATLEVAKVYKDHPLLSEFPVPKMTLDEVVIDLKISFAAGPSLGGFLTPESRANIIARLEKLLSELPSTEPSLKDLVKEFPQLQEIWKSSTCISDVLVTMDCA